MALSLKLSRFLRTSLKVDMKLSVLHRMQIINSIRCADVSSLPGRCPSIYSSTRMLYSTTPKLSEATNTNHEESTDALKDERNKVERETINVISSEKDGRDHHTQLVDDLKILDEQVRQLGRVDREQVDQMLKKCKKGMTSVEAIMLLRCAGSLLVKESLEERKEILEKVWRKVEDCCPMISTDVMNALMAVKIENLIKFEPAEELAKLEESKNIPTKATYNLLMAQYCEVGDVQGASEVLNHMKSLDWPINISAIHSLIKGYVNIGNFTEATNVITSMKQHGLRPTADTYTIPMIGYAGKGDLDAIKEAMAAVMSKGIKIPLKNAYDIILKLAMSGHEDKVEEALDILISIRLYEHQVNQEAQFNRRNVLQQRRLDYQDSMNLVYQLGSSGHYNVVVPVLRKIINSSILSEQFVSNLTMKAVISELFRKEKPVKEVLEVRQMLLDENFLVPEFEPIAHWAMKLREPRYILELFGELKNLGMITKPHYFWPLFYRAKTNKNVEDIYKLTEYVFKDVPASLNSICQTIFQWSFESLRALKEDPKTILEQYKIIKISKNIRDIIELTYLTKEGRFKDIQQLIENGHQFSIMMIKDNLIEGLGKADHETKDLMELLKLLNDKVNMNLKTNGYFLLSVVNSFDANSSDKLNKFLESWINNDLKILEKMAHPVMTQAIARGASKDIIEKISGISTNTTDRYKYKTLLSKDLDMKILSSVSTPKQLQTPKVLKPVKVKQGETETEDEGGVASQAKNLLDKREYKDFRNMIFEMSEKGDVDGLNLLFKLKIPKSNKDFFNKCLFAANIKSGKAKEYLETLKASRDNFGKYISPNILLKLHEKDVALFNEVEDFLKKLPSQELKYISPYASLYTFYLIKEDKKKIDELFQAYPSLKKQIKLGFICMNVKLNKNENILHQVIQIHKDPEDPKIVAPPYNNLLLIKCETNDHKVALDIYNEALGCGLTFDDFSVRALQAFQSVLQGNNQPLPWKEGEVEKKAELAAMKKHESSSSSDSE